MKVLKIVGIVVAAIVAIVLVIGLVAPKNYDVKRETVIKAPPATIYFTISHFSEFPKWSPWQELDPNMKTTLEGTDGTIGAKYSWEGNDKAGAGSMTITKMEDGKSMEEGLEFLKPFKSSATVYFNLEPADGGGTKVVWGMKGESGFVSGIFMTLMGGMDKAIGKDYEKGLAKLKTLCEIPPAAPAYEVTEADWTEKNCISVRKVVEFKDFPTFFGEHVSKMYEAVGKAKAKPGNLIGVYYDYNEKEMKADFAIALPYEGAKVSSKEYPALNLPANTGYSINYKGAYEKMKPAYDAMSAKLKELGKDNPDMVIEEYLSGPMTEKDTTKWETVIYFFINKPGEVAVK